MNEILIGFVLDETGIGLLVDGFQAMRSYFGNAGRAFVVGVPENQARYIISPTFINGMRAASERLKVFPIISVVRTWSGRSR